MWAMIAGALLLAAPLDENCDRCLGDGLLTCALCEGDYESVLADVECEKCGGTGGILCRTCKGDKRVRCRECHGDGRVGRHPCIACRKGSVGCPTCNQRGTTVCATCDGRKVVRRQGPCPACTKGLIPCPRCQRRNALRQPESEVPAFFDVFTRAAERRAEAMQAAPQRTPAEEQRALREWLEVNAAHASGLGPELRRYAARIERFLELVRESTRQPLVFNAEGRSTFIARRAGEPVFLVTGVSSDFQIPAKKRQLLRNRGRFVLMRTLGPLLEAYQRAFADSESTAFGVLLYYGPANLPDNDRGKPIGIEAVAIVVPSNVCNGYVSGRFSLADVLKKSDCFQAGTERKLGLARIEWD